MGPLDGETFSHRKSTLKSLGVKSGHSDTRFKSRVISVSIESFRVKIGNGEIYETSPSTVTLRITVER